MTCDSTPAGIWAQTLGSQGAPGSIDGLTADAIPFTPTSGVMAALGADGTPVGDSVGDFLSALEALLAATVLADPSPGPNSIGYFDSTGAFVPLTPPNTPGVPQSLVVDAVTGLLTFKPIGGTQHITSDNNQTNTGGLNSATTIPFNLSGNLVDHFPGSFAPSTANPGWMDFTAPVDGWYNLGVSGGFSTQVVTAPTGPGVIVVGVDVQMPGGNDLRLSQHTVFVDTPSYAGEPDYGDINGSTGPVFLQAGDVASFHAGAVQFVTGDHAVAFQFAQIYATLVA